jgi:hypothetical protein
MVFIVRQGDGMFPEWRILVLMRDSKRGKIRSERRHARLPRLSESDGGQGRRSERSEGNMPSPRWWKVENNLKPKNEISD